MKFKMFFQTVPTTFGPAKRDDETGFGYDHRFRSIGVGAVTRKGEVWLFSYDYETSPFNALPRWVRADGGAVEPIPGQPS